MSAGGMAAIPRSRQLWEHASMLEGMPWQMADDPTSLRVDLDAPDPDAVGDAALALAGWSERPALSASRVVIVGSVRPITTTILAAKTAVAP